MGKAIDKAAVSLLAAIIAFLIFYRLSNSILIGAISALLLIVMIAIALTKIHPHEPKDILSKRDYVRLVLLRGNEVLKNAVELSIGSEYEIVNADGHTLLKGKNHRILLYYAYKFGSLSEEDIAKSYRIAEKNGATSIYALTNHIDRKAIAVTEYIPQKVTVIGAGILYKYLSKRKLIPAKSTFGVKKKRFGKGLGLAVNARNTKYYILAGLTTSLIALFTPFTIYYLVFSFVNLMLALSCVIFSEKSDGKNELFRE